MKAEIIKFIKGISYFDDESDEYETIEFATRQNGDIYNEESSDLDYQEGRRVKKELLAKFDGIEVNIDTVDEWVLLSVTII
jgi:hypothetical protein